MTSLVATVAFAVGIGGLFVLGRKPEARASKALWIPVAWLFIAGSRSVSLWLQGGSAPVSLDPNASLEGNPVDRYVLFGLLAAGFIVLVTRRLRIRAFLRANAPILLFFLYCAVSVLWSDYPAAAFKHWTRALGDLVMVLVVLTDPDRGAALDRLFARLGFLLMPLSILLIKYYPDMGRYYGRWEGRQFFGGVTTNKNTLGMTCMILGIGAVWRFLAVYRDRTGPRRIQQMVAQGALLAMVVWLIKTADSMTSISCFVIASALIVVTSLSLVARRLAVVHVLVAGVLFVSAYALFLDASGSLVETVARDPTLTGRTEIWHLVIRMSGNPLFGTGFESFWLGDRLARLWDMYWWHPNEAHNGYLEVFLNLGWIGVTLLALVIVKGYRNVIVVFRRDPDVGKLWLAYFAAALVYSFTEAGFRMNSLTWIFLLFAAIAVPELPSSESRTSDHEGRPNQSHADLWAVRDYIHEEVGG
jgi:exopolysaccharide production protein ExoQ